LFSKQPGAKQIGNIESCFLIERLLNTRWGFCAHIREIISHPNSFKISYNDKEENEKRHAPQLDKRLNLEYVGLSPKMTKRAINSLRYQDSDDISA